MSRAGRTSTRERGDQGEEVAAAFLQRSGYTIVERNYYHRHGEIDIIAREGTVLAFVEVKTRRSTAFGRPEESVTPKKQELLRRTAEGYMLDRNIDEAECRFDVVAVLLQNGTAECELFRDCF